MSRLELTKSAIDSFGYVDVDRKNLEAIEAEIRADERRKVLHEQRAKVLEEVREVTKTIEASDILKMAKSCNKNCCECDGCLTTLLFEEMQEEK